MAISLTHSVGQDPHVATLLGMTVVVIARLGTSRGNLSLIPVIARLGTSRGNLSPLYKTDPHVATLLGMTEGVTLARNDD